MSKSGSENDEALHRATKASPYEGERLTPVLVAAAHLRTLNSKPTFLIRIVIRPKLEEHDFRCGLHPEEQVDDLFKVSRALLW